MLERNLLRQPVHATGCGNETHARFGKAKARVLGGNHEIAGQRDLEASTYGHAIHRGDQRLHALETTGNAAKGQERSSCRLLSRRRRGGGGFEIVARAECPVSRPRDNGNPGLVVMLEIVEDLVQLHVRLRAGHSSLRAY